MDKISIHSLGQALASLPSCEEWFKENRKKPLTVEVTTQLSVALRNYDSIHKFTFVSEISVRNEWGPVCFDWILTGCELITMEDT